MGVAHGEEFITYQRQVTSAENGVRFLTEFAHIDVSALAHQVRCPTLILHSRRDARVPITQADELATLIPGSRLILLDSGSHLLTSAEPAWAEFVSHIQAFLSGGTSLPVGRRPGLACAGRPWHGVWSAAGGGVW